MEPSTAPPEIDTTRAHPARMYDVYLGGKDNYAADREAARKVVRVVPEIRAMARENRAFLQRAVRYLVGEAGIRQIIDIGTGLPTAGNVHEVAQAAAPGTRVVCVDNDPIVNVHASALLTGTSPVGIVQADLRDPAAILADPKVQQLIDFTQPVALLLVAVLHFIADTDGPRGIVATLRDALAPGSYLALSHGTGDLHTAATVDRAAAAYKQATAPLVLRSHAGIAAFFDGFDLTEPGLVQVPLWRPDPGRAPLPPAELRKIGIYGGVGRR